MTTDINLDEKALEAARDSITPLIKAAMTRYVAGKHSYDKIYVPKKTRLEIAEAAIKAYKANEVDDGWMDIPDDDEDAELRG